MSAQKLVVMANQIATFFRRQPEAEAVANIAKAEGLMRRLRKLGCGVALDDFGTGLSSSSYLRAMPVTLLQPHRLMTVMTTKNVSCSTRTP